MFAYIFHRNCLLFLLIAIMLSSCSTSKSTLVTPDYKVNIPVEAKLMNVDEFGFIYVVTHDNTLIKYDRKGEQLYKYSPIHLGDIEKIDLTNPHKIMIFFPDFQIIKFLDNTLSEISSFLLSKVGDEITQVAMSNDNNIWLYDMINRKILKVTHSGNELFSSQPLSDIVDGVFSPTFLYENNNQVYIYDANAGLLIFDFSAHFIKRYILPDKQVIYVDNDFFTYIEGHEIKSDNYSDNTVDLKDINQSLAYKPLTANYYNGKWIVLSEKGIVFY